MKTDAELIHRDAGQKNERAFAARVERHLGLVRATALRTTTTVDSWIVGAA